MHDSSERRPGTSRPSLLGGDAGPAHQDHSILSQLDGRKTPSRGAPASVPRKRGRGAGTLLLGVGIAGIATMAWLALGSGSRSPDAVMASAHAPAPAPVLAPARAVAAAPAAAVPVSASVDAASELPKPAAVIQDDLAATLDTPARPSPGADKSLPRAPEEKQDLASLLDAPAAAAPASVSRQGKPATAPREVARKDSAAKKPATDKLARADKARAPAAPAKPKPKQKAAPKKAAPPVDTDVALLAALLAHTKAPAGSAEDIFKRCATNATAAEVQRCRVRVCQGSAKGAAECKSVRISKVSS